MRPLLIASFAALALSVSARAQAVIRKGDVLQMRVGGVPVEYAAEFQLDYSLGDDGNVRVPLIGGVKALGVTADQLSRAIEQRFVTGKIFTNPTVAVTVQPQSRFVTVGGAVQSPQAVPWTEDMKLSQAIVRAGGEGGFWRGKAKLTRDGATSILNLRRADKDPAQNPKLLPGDEVTLLD